MRERKFLNKKRILRCITVIIILILIGWMTDAFYRAEVFIAAQTDNQEKMIHLLTDENSRYKKDIVSQIIDKQMDLAMTYMEEDIFDESPILSNQSIHYILSQYDQKSIVHADIDHLLDYFINDSYKESNQQTIMNIIGHYPVAQVTESFETKIREAYSVSDLSLAIHLIDKYESLEIEPDHELYHVQAPLELLIDAYLFDEDRTAIQAILDHQDKNDLIALTSHRLLSVMLEGPSDQVSVLMTMHEAIEHDPGIQEMAKLYDNFIVKQANIADSTQQLTRLKSIVNGIYQKCESGQKDIAGYIGKIQYKTDEISQYRTTLEYHAQAFNMEFYVFQQIGDHSYEIAPLGYRFYSYKEPEEVHAILYTSDISFTTTGWYTLKVYYTGSMPIKTTAGFSQDWNMYQEYGSAEKAVYQQCVDGIESLKNEMEGYYNTIQDLDDDISSDTAAIKESNVMPILELELHIRNQKNQLSDIEKQLIDLAGSESTADFTYLTPVSYDPIVYYHKNMDGFGSITYPVLFGWDTELENSLNASMEEMGMLLRRDIPWIKEQEDSPNFFEQSAIDYRIASINGSCVSIIRTMDAYPLGESDNDHMGGFVLDVKNNTILGLENLFTEETDVYQLLNETIMKSTSASFEGLMLDEHSYVGYYIEDGHLSLLWDALNYDTPDGKDFSVTIELQPWLDLLVIPLENHVI